MSIKSNTPKGVIKQPAKRYQSFNEGWSMLPAKYQPEVKAKLIASFGYKPGDNASFYRLIRGEYKTNPAEREKIEEIFHAYDINPWTGKTGFHKEKTKSLA